MKDDIVGIRSKYKIRIPKLIAFESTDYTPYYILIISAIICAVLFLIFWIDLQTDFGTEVIDGDADGLDKNPEELFDGRFTIQRSSGSQVKKDLNDNTPEDELGDQGNLENENSEWKYVEVKQPLLGWMDYLPMAFMILLAPYGITEGMKRRRLERIEDKFPDFIKDLAEYWKGGLSMTTAIDTISRGEYGALNKDVRQMATQISWGVSFEDVLRLFADRVKTPLVERSVMMVNEANKAGGSISDILLTAAADAREIRYLKDDRKKNLGMYNLVIYVSFAVYLAVIIIIAGVFLPAIAEANIGGGGEGAGQIGGLTVQKINPLDINIIFWGSTIVQAIGNGMMAGVMTDGTFSSGAKHGSLMLLITWLSFKFLVFPIS